MLATSMLASRLTIPVALSALQSPDNLDGLLLALQASAAALLLAVLVGRTVARDAAREQRS
jgi:ABC-type sulfate transport system permease component